MVSEWMGHGNINEFVDKYEGVDRVQLVSGHVASWGDRRDVYLACRRRERVGVHAQHSHGTRRLEGGMNLLFGSTRTKNSR